MTCREAATAETVMDYIVPMEENAEAMAKRYGGVCYAPVDEFQAVLYSEGEITSENIRRYGYLSVPSCLGLMDMSALEEMGVLRVRRQPYIDLYGRGTLIGFVDTGIDWTHEAFRNADNTSRIAGIWDQTLTTGEPPEGLPYGREYTQEELNTALASSNPRAQVTTMDTDGHGTFLAGVAAGNIVNSAGFSGVAPDCELLVVKCKQAKQIYRNYYCVPTERPCYQENDVMLGVRYLLMQAKRLGRPLVICIGMGTNLGNHAGNCALGQMLGRYSTTPNVAVVTPTGNEGNARHHFAGDIPTNGDYQDVDINVENNLLGFVAEVWWRSPGKYSVGVISPSGEELGRIRVYPTITRRRRFVLENTLVEIYFGEILGQSRDQVIFIRFEDSKPGVWKIRIYQENPLLRTFNVWLPITEFLQAETYFLQPSPDETICEPSNRPELITMAAYNDLDEGIYLRSGRGYNTAGDVKPDVAAPGVEILGPAPNGSYGERTGTSVAAALTAGVCALVFQQYGEYEISGLAVLELLIQGAKRGERIYPNREWGYGAIDLYNTIVEQSDIS